MKTHYILSTANEASLSWRTVCGNFVYTNSYDTGSYDTVSTEPSNVFITCKKCRLVKSYEQDRLIFELKYEGNFNKFYDEFWKPRALKIQSTV